MPNLGKITHRSPPWLNRHRVEYRIRDAEIDGDEWREYYKANLLKKLTAAQPDNVARKLEKELKRLEPKRRKKR